VYEDAADRAWNKWKAIDPGALAPDIVGTDIDGNEIKLSDFKGKVVYIDVWATWCGPCRQQIPFLQEAEAEMHGQDVVFLSVSIDNDRARWKKMVTEDEMKGVQMHVTGGWSAQVCRQYLITGIPRFMLIDKEGRIVNTRAPRPSQGIVPMLEKLL
jgi:thiol-disulfide isomerase/thioredoxin